MQVQKSFTNEDVASIYVVPTPIGNLEDITFRAINVLKKVSIIAAEDTRITRKLLTHFDIQTSLISYHEHSRDSREEQLINRLKDGESIAIVSDAGMPAISDPGYNLIQSAIEEDIPIIALPGANAALCALVASGLPTDEFLFYGFLPRKKKDKEKEITRLKMKRATLIFYESPYRVKETLSSLMETLGNRKIALARELTKRYEEYIRGTITELMEWTKNKELKGEFCIVVEGTKDDMGVDDTLWWSHLPVKEHVTHYMEVENLSSKEAIKIVAKEREMSRREVYQIFHVD